MTYAVAAGTHGREIFTGPGTATGSLGRSRRPATTLTPLEFFHPPITKFILLYGSYRGDHAEKILKAPLTSIAVPPVKISLKRMRLTRPPRRTSLKKGRGRPCSPQRPCYLFNANCANQAKC